MPGARIGWRETLMNTGRIDFLTGAAFTLLSLFLLLVLTPLGVDVPTASVTEVGSKTPRFFPNFITCLMLVFSVALSVKGWLNRGDGQKRDDGRQVPAARETGSDGTEDDVNRRGFSPTLIRCASILALLGMYYTADWMGMVLASFILYILYALFTGERRPFRALLGAIICSGLLYYFFVYIGGIPMPLGVFFS